MSNHPITFPIDLHHPAESFQLGPNQIFGIGGRSDHVVPVLTVQNRRTVHITDRPVPRNIQGDPIVVYPTICRSRQRNSFGCSVEQHRTPGHRATSVKIFQSQLRIRLGKLPRRRSDHLQSRSYQRQIGKNQSGPTGISLFQLPYRVHTDLYFVGHPHIILIAEHIVIGIGMFQQKHKIPVSTQRTGYRSDSMDIWIFLLEIVYDSRSCVGRTVIAYVEIESGESLGQ